MLHGSPRSRALVWTIPLILALVSTARMSDSVRTVDMVKILASGMVVAFSLMNIVEALKSRSTPKP
jgi:hypothetical protein